MTALQWRKDLAEKAKKLTLERHIIPATIPGQDVNVVTSIFVQRSYFFW